MQADAGQRHYVLIHGACHGAWCWYKVSSLLKSAGHMVSALDLAASGINSKQVDQLHSLSDYFEPLFEFMASLPSEERVILVGHSMGGYGISVAMEKFPEKISAGVFVAAGMLGSDLSYKRIAAKYAKRFMSSTPMDTKYYYGNGPNNHPTAILPGPKDMASKSYRFSPPEDLELAIMLTRPFPMFSNSEAENEMVVTKERHGSVSRIFVVCDEENSEEQRWMIENNPPDEVKEISGSDHMVMFSKPQELSSCLLEIGEKYF